ncbi:hypothetical protein MMC13_007079 [Lambiella insularis]|nr:hypothetical protein [Lambiella insularis]
MTSQPPDAISGLSHLSLKDPSPTPSSPPPSSPNPKHPTATPSLPLIDISPFLTPSPTPTSLTTTTTALSSALLSHGFFYLTHHTIPPALLAHVLSLARAFFLTASPGTKHLIKRHPAGTGCGDGARGYQRLFENTTAGRRDAHEAIDWYRPVEPGEGLTGKELTFFKIWGDCGIERARQGHDDVLRDKKGEVLVFGEGERVRKPPYGVLRGVNLWPDEPSAMREVYGVYVREMLRVGEGVLRAMGRAAGVGEGRFVGMTRESFWVMRAIGYPPLEGGEEEEREGVSCGAHTDYGCLTMLLADGTRGALQVRGREGGVDADPVEGALVVNIGDMMERWTNGLWKSTEHRVVHRGDGYRVSVPFFLEPDFEAVVRPLEECVEKTGGVEKWGPVKYGDHLLGKVGGNFYEEGAGKT